MPVTVDTPLCVTDQATFMTVVRKYKPKKGRREGGREEDARGGRGSREVDCDNLSVQCLINASDAREKKKQLLPGFEPGSSECRSDVLTN